MSAVGVALAAGVALGLAVVLGVGLVVPAGEVAGAVRGESGFTAQEASALAPIPSNAPSTARRRTDEGEEGLIMSVLERCLTIGNFGGCEKRSELFKGA